MYLHQDNYIDEMHMIELKLRLSSLLEKYQLLLKKDERFPMALISNNSIFNRTHYPTAAIAVETMNRSAVTRWLLNDDADGDANDETMKLPLDH